METKMLGYKMLEKLVSNWHKKYIFVCINVEIIKFTLEDGYTIDILYGFWKQIPQSRTLNTYAPFPAWPCDNQPY